MHIRRLARNAAFIAVAAIAAGGFLTGIAGATNAAPTSTISVVTPGGTTPRMLPNCDFPGHFCTFASSIHGLVLLQKFGCATRENHGAAAQPPNIYEIANGCDWRWLWYNPTEHCINPLTVSAGTNRFPHVTGYYSSPYMSC